MLIYLEEEAIPNLADGRTRGYLPAQIRERNPIEGYRRGRHKALHNTT